MLTSRFISSFLCFSLASASLMATTTTYCITADGDDGGYCTSTNSCSSQTCYNGSIGSITDTVARINDVSEDANIIFKVTNTNYLSNSCQAFEGTKIVNIYAGQSAGVGLSIDKENRTYFSISGETTVNLGTINTSYPIAFGQNAMGTSSSPLLKVDNIKGKFVFGTGVDFQGRVGLKELQLAQGSVQFQKSATLGTSEFLYTTLSVGSSEGSPKIHLDNEVVITVPGKVKRYGDDRSTLYLNGSDNSSNTGARLRFINSDAAQQLDYIVVDKGAALEVKNPFQITEITLKKGSIYLDKTNTLEGVTITGSDSSSVIYVDSEQSPATLNAVLSGNAFSKKGAGTLALEDASAYTGSMTIKEGILKLTGSGSIANSSLTANSGTTFDASEISASSLTLKNLSGAGTVIFGSKNFILNQTADTTFSGSIASGGTLTKTGTFTLTLSGNTTYSGSTGINEGTLKLTGSSAIGIASPLTVDSEATFDASGISADSLTFGTLYGQGNLKFGHKNFTVNETSGSTFSGNIESGGDFTKTGASTLTLSGNIDYVGSTTINQGTLKLTGSSSLEYSSLTVNSGATFDASGISAGSLRLKNLSGAGTVKLGTKNFTLDQTANTTFSGTIESGGNFTKTGSTLTLSGNSGAYTGSTTVSTGTLKLTGNGAIANSPLTVSSGATFDASGVSTSPTVKNLSGAGTVQFGEKDFTLNQTANSTFSGTIASGNSLTKTGTSILTLSGDSSIYTGSTIVSAGTLNLTESGSIANSPLTVNSEATFDASGVSTSPTVKNLSGAGTVQFGEKDFTLNQTADTEFSGPIASGVNFTKTGPSTLTLSGNNNYSGNITVHEGGLCITKQQAIEPCTITLDGGATFKVGLGSEATLENSFILNSGLSSIEVVNKVNVQGTISGAGGLNKKGAGTLKFLQTASYTGATTVSAGTLDLSSVSNALTIYSLSGAGNLILNSQAFVIDQSSTGTFSGSLTSTKSMTKKGSAELVLSGSNTGFSGDITVEGGTLTAGTSNALGTGTGITTLYDGATFKIDVGSTITMNNPFILNSGLSSIEVVNDVNVNGTISGAGGLNKKGAGTLKFLQTASYTGATTVSAGTLDLSSVSNALTIYSLSGAGNLILNSQAFVIDQSSTGTFSGSLTSTKSMTKTGSAELVLSGSNTGFSGDITVEGGTLTAGTSNALGTGAVTIGDALLKLAGNNMIVSNPITLAGSVSSIEIPNGQIATINSVISGPGGFQTLDTGTLKLYGVNTNTGAVEFFSGAKVYFMGDGSMANASSMGLSGTGAALNIAGITSSSTTIRNLKAEDVNASIELGSKTLIANQSSSKAVISAVIEGDDSSVFSKIGDYTLSLQGSNTATGTLAVDATGTLQVESLDGTDASALNAIKNFTTLRISNGGTLSLINPSKTSNLTVSGALKMGSGGGTLHLENAWTLSTAITDVDENDPGSLNFSGEGSCSLIAKNSYLQSTFIETGSAVVLGSDASLYEGQSTGFGTVGVQGILEGTASSSVINGDVGIYGGGILQGSMTINGEVTGSGSEELPSTIYVTGDSSSLSSSRAIKASAPQADMNVQSMTLEPYSNLKFGVNGTSFSSLAVENTLTIGDNVGLELNTTLNFILPQTVYSLISYEDIVGSFEAGAYVPGVLLTTQVNYGAHELTVTMDYHSLTDFATDANSYSVAVAVDTLLKTGVYSVPSNIVKILALASPEQINAALNQVQPAQLKAATIVQENNMVEVRNTLSIRMQEALNQKYCGACLVPEDPFHVWVTGFGDFLSQDSARYADSPQIGYSESGGGASLGIDYHFAEAFYAGALGAYTDSSLDWSQGQGSGTVQSGYAGVYLSGLGKMFYGNLAAIGSWNHFDEKRNILLPLHSYKANNTHGGSQFLAHADTGVNFGWKQFAIRPFDSFDYVTQTENAFTESGAGVLDLSVEKSNAILLRNELGLQFAGCFCVRSSRWTVTPKISWVREVRIKGGQYTASFEGTDVPFTVTGYFPDRSLVSPGVTLTGAMLNDLLTVSLYYNGAFKGNYSDHNVGGEIRFGF